MTYDIRHNQEETQFEIIIDGHLAIAAYDLE